MSIVNDDLGDRMKMYEGVEARRVFMPLLPIVARLDGRSFSKFTKGLDRPFDKVFSDIMIETTSALVKSTGACIGYTQSDEISLAWHSESISEQVWFDGRVSKMTSQLAAQATLIFYRLVLQRLPDFADRLPSFDARVWNVPNRTEGANVFVWREWDATKNSISMAASHYYPHSELLYKNGSEKQDMLHAVGVNWNDYPIHFKRGTYVQRKFIKSKFTAEDIDKLPVNHAVRSNTDLVVERSIYVELDLPPITKISNREDVIFKGSTPILFTETY